MHVLTASAFVGHYTATTETKTSKSNYVFAEQNILKLFIFHKICRYKFLDFTTLMNYFVKFILLLTLQLHICKTFFFPELSRPNFTTKSEVKRSNISVFMHNGL